MPLAVPDLMGFARQSLPLGEIRTGKSREVPGKNGREPVRLDAFRFTTPSRPTVAAVAENFGGDPAVWDRRPNYWVVDTEVAQIDVWVPPRGLAVDTNMEMWGGSPAKCLRWCDGRLERRSGQPCMCPMPDDPTDPASVQRAYEERKRLAALNPPRACKVKTRYNLQIPQLPGLTGVWKLITGSANAARWSADCGEVLERARDAGAFLPASLEITLWPGRDGYPYPVPILRPKQSAVQVAAGELPSGLNGLLAQLRGSEARQALPAAAPPQPEPAAAPADRPAGRKPPATPQQIADLAAAAQGRAELQPLFGLTKARRWTDEQVQIEGALEGLGAYLEFRWDRVPDDRPGAAA